eukprot:6198225-Pleurochrysis_carterae.AAC.1
MSSGDHTARAEGKTARERQSAKGVGEGAGKWRNGGMCRQMVKSKPVKSKRQERANLKIDAARKSSSNVHGPMLEAHPLIPGLLGAS